MSAVTQKPKTFKLRALHSQKKFGVAGKSCEEVLRKGCLRLQHPRRRGARASHHGPDLAGLVFQKPHAGLIQAARQLLSDERAPLRQKLLADLLHTVSENIAAETRAEDPPWFEGLEARFRNKSGYLRYSCESRIRSYLREVTSCASLVGGEAQEEYQRIVGAMCRKLQEARYHGSYFDRGAKAGGRLCTPEGWFSCQGPFDVDDCASRHSINPYSNRESRVLFSTWNLDHMCEHLIQTVVPETMGFPVKLQRLQKALKSLLETPAPVTSSSRLPTRGSERTRPFSKLTCADRPPPLRSSSSELLRGCLLARVLSKSLNKTEAHRCHLCFS
nr:DNA fragmentation factor subunit beta isoform X9 [Camelus dromedarius]